MSWLLLFSAEFSLAECDISIGSILAELPAGNLQMEFSSNGLCRWQCRTPERNCLI